MRELLRLMQLSDSAVPIGAAAHSFGLEGLVDSAGVSDATLMPFVESFLEEQGMLEACFCRAAYDCGRHRAEAHPLCLALSALRAAREAREASIVLGRRLLGMLQTLLDRDQALILARAFEPGEPHHAIVFGYVASVLAVDREMAVAAFLHQAVTTMVSSAQRLMPVGQRQAAAVLWRVKDTIAACAERSRELDTDTVASFLPELEIASMRHPNLETRLFLS